MGFFFKFIQTKIIIKGENYFTLFFLYLFTFFQPNSNFSLSPPSSFPLTFICLGLGLGLGLDAMKSVSSSNYFFKKMVIVFTFHNYFYLKNLKLLNDEKLIGCNTYKYITYQGFIKILKFKQTLPYNFEF